MLGGMPLPLSPLFRWLPVATVAAAALAAALWLTVHPAIAALAAPAEPPAVAGPVAAGPVAAGPVADGTEAARGGASADAQAEFNRVVALMAYTQATQRFHALRAQGTVTPELLALARLLDDGLPQRLARQELSATEAQALQAALREVFGPASTATAAR